MPTQFWEEMFQVYYRHVKMQQCGAGRFRSVSAGVGVCRLPGVTAALDYKDICFLFNLDSWGKRKKATKLIEEL